MLRKINISAKDLLFCLLSSALLCLPFSGLDCAYLAWFAFIPFFAAIEKKSKTDVFILSYLTGIFFWAGAIYWLIHVTLLGQVMLIIYLSLYFALFGLSCVLPGLSAKEKLFCLPCSWMVMEYLRSNLFGGFPWALLGHSQYANLLFIQITDIAGVYLISYLVMLVNVSLYMLLNTGERRKDSGYLFPALFLVIVIIYGYYRLNSPAFTDRSCSLKVAVVQGNIPQQQKWDAEFRGKIIERYRSESLASLADKPELIIWPEAALPGVLGRDSGLAEKLFPALRDIGRYVLTGAVTLDRGSYHNSAILFGPSAEPVARYDKLHLVPFGEYIPFRSTFPFLETIAPIGDIAPGADYTLFRIPQAKESPSIPSFGVLICFEDLFPELSAEFVRRKAGFLVNITNDAWYMKTSAAIQHLQACVFRAVENRVPLVRSANTGISAFIDPTGRILSFVSSGREKIFVLGHKTEKLYCAAGPLTFYNKNSDWFVLMCSLLYVCCICLALRRSRGQAGTL